MWHVHVYFTIRFRIPTPMRWWSENSSSPKQERNRLLCRFIWGTGWLCPTTLTSCNVGRGIQRWKGVNCWYALQRMFCVYLHSHFCGHNSTVHVRRDTLDHELIAEYTGISRSTVLQLSWYDLIMHETAAKWVPHNINEMQLWMRYDMITY
jgi:hypothetical protein